MGLDMYLYAEAYLSGFDKESEEYKLYRKISETMKDYGLPLTEKGDFDSVTVKFVVAYWRKANPIHKWFVENCQNGVDECQTSFVKREKLEELVSLCKLTLEKIDELEEKEKTIDLETMPLPPTCGFFFGPTDNLDWYKDDMKMTIEQIESALKFPDTWAFYYRSSW